MKRLKILIIPSWYPTKDEPVSGIFFKEQAEALSQYLDVAILYLYPISPNQHKQLSLKERVFMHEENGVFTFKFSYVNWIRRIQLFKDILIKRNIMKSYEQVVEKWGKPDLIHAHVTYPAGYEAMVLSRKYNVPFVVTEHATFFGRLLLNHKYIVKQTLANSNYYTAVGNELRNKIVKAGRSQCEIIPNFVNKDKYKILTTKPQNNEKFNLINISILTEKKGIDILLYSLHKLINVYGYDNIHLKIVGDGPKLNEYVKLSKTLNINSNCTFYGRVNDKDLVENLKRSHALVISSRMETFGVVGIEAMASGIPVIATKCGGPEDYINEEVGILVEKENVDSLANGIIGVMENYETYNPLKIRKHFENNYSDVAVCEKIINMYEKVLQTSDL